MEGKLISTVSIQKLGSKVRKLFCCVCVCVSVCVRVTDFKRICTLTPLNIEGSFNFSVVVFHLL